MKFKKLTESFTDGYKIGDRVELANGQTATVVADYILGDDYISVEIEGTGERKYPWVNTVRLINETRTELQEPLKENVFDDDDYIWPIGSNTLTSTGAKKRLTDIRNDLKIMLNCETLEDVQNHKEEFSVYDCVNIIQRHVDSGLSEEDAIEKMQSHLINTWSKWKEDVVKFKLGADKAYATFNKIKDSLTQYELIDADEEKCILKYKPTEGATHKDCVEFVDAVVAAVSGKYHFTGRGGSWTRWDILTSDGVTLKAGWDGDIWSVGFPRLKFECKLNETYWIDDKAIMNEVDNLGKELEADGFKFYSDRYSGSTYYNFYTKRGENGAICKAVQYNYNGAQIIDVTVDQMMGYEPIDSFEELRRKLGKILLPKEHEKVQESYKGSETSSVKVLCESQEMASWGMGLDDDGEIAAMRAEQKELDAKRLARKERFALMHRLFDTHIDAEPEASWVDKVYRIFDNAESITFVGNKHGLIPGKTYDKQPIRYRYSIKEYDFYSDPYWEIIYVAQNNIDPMTEDLEANAQNFPYMFFYNCNNPTFGYDFQIFASSLGAKKAYGRYKGTAPGSYFYLVPSEEVYNKLKEVAKSKYTVDMQRLLPYDAEEYPNVQLMKEDMTSTQYIIVGVTANGTRMFYNAVEDQFVNEVADATKYDDMDVARDDWFKIPRTGFRRIFIPVYDPAVFESYSGMNEAINQSVIDDAIEYYKQNRFGYDGIEDYVNTDFSHYPEDKRKEVITALKAALDENTEKSI